MAASFTCPSCKKVLKSAAAIPAGKVVKCPGCQTQFKVPAGDNGIQGKPATEVKKSPPPGNGKVEGGATQIRKGATGVSKSAAAGRGEVDDGKKTQAADTSARRRPRRDEDDEDDRPRGRSRRDQDDEDDRPRRRSRRDDDDEDDRPRRARPQARSGNPMLILLLLGGGAFCMLVLFCARAAFVWPGFMQAQPAAAVDQPLVVAADKGDGHADAARPAATDFAIFLPEDADLAMGFRLGGANNAVLKKLLKGLSETFPDQQDKPAVTEFLLNVDSVIVAGEATKMSDVKNGGPVVGVIQTEKPVDMNKLQKVFKAADPQQLHGKNVFRADNGGIAYLADPRSILVMKLPDDEAGKILNSAKPRLRHTQMLQQIRKVNSNTIWCVTALDGSLRGQIMQMANPQMMQQKPPFPRANELLPVIQSAKMLTYTANLSAGSIQINATLTCANDADAKKSVHILEPMAKLSLNTIVDLLRTQPLPNNQANKLSQLLMSDIDTFSLQSTGPDFTAGLTLQKATVDALVDMANGLLEKGSGSGDGLLKLQSTNNLKQITLAMHGYHDVYKQLPPQAICSRVNGAPLLSWRVQLLPYLEEAQLYQQFRLDEPWNGPNNIKLLAKMPRVYAKPGAKNMVSKETHYQVITGPGAPFELRRNNTMPFGAEGFSFQSFSNGTSNTFGVAEAAKPVIWTKPDDLVFNPQGPPPRFGGIFADGFHVSMLDGSTKFVANNLKDDLRRFMLRQGKVGLAPGPRPVLDDMLLTAWK